MNAPERPLVFHPQHEGELARRLRAGIRGGVLFDRASRGRYSTDASIYQVAPVGVHIKELNQIAPLAVESLRVDHVRHVDPLRIDRLNITQLPSVNITMSQLPMLDLNVRRVPPVTVALHQQFEMKSNSPMRARVFGLKLRRPDLRAPPCITPRDSARREVSRQHERSFADVAAARKPAIPSHAVEKSCTAVTHRPKHHHHHHKTRRPMLHAGAPRFGYSLHPQDDTAPAGPTAHSAIHMGG